MRQRDHVSILVTCQTINQLRTHIMGDFALVTKTTGRVTMAVNISPQELVAHYRGTHSLAQPIPTCNGVESCVRTARLAQCPPVVPNLTPV